MEISSGDHKWRPQVESSSGATGICKFILYSAENMNIHTPLYRGSIPI